MNTPTNANAVTRAALGLAGALGVAVALSMLTRDHGRSRPATLVAPPRLTSVPRPNFSECGCPEFCTLDHEND